MIVLLTIACHTRASAPAPGVQAAPPAPPPAWLKGQTHVHSANSGDSATPPADVARWYAAHGYDFIVFTDHNAITELSTADAAGLLAIPGVELTQNLETCDPPPEPGLACLLHVNALFVRPGELAWPAARSVTRADVYQRALDVTAALGGLAQLNHPNFHYAADAALVTTLARRGAVLLEVANAAIDSNNEGDARHPDTEALWDAALTAGVTVWGVASDDAHHYDDAAAVEARGQLAFRGDRGWVMVHAAREPAAIRAALARGDFYSSTGVLLGQAGVADGALVVTVDDATPDRGAHHIRFVGAGGHVLAEREGRTASYALAAVAAGGYVRAVVTDAAGRRAWVQPAR